MYVLIEVSNTEAFDFFDRLDVMCDLQNFETVKIVWQSEILNITIVDDE